MLPPGRRLALKINNLKRDKKFEILAGPLCNAYMVAFHFHLGPESQSGMHHGDPETSQEQLLLLL